MTREEAIKILYERKNTMEYVTDNDDLAFDMAINALEQEPKTGHWFIDERPESNREIICSNCEHPIFKYHKLDFDYRPKYCPNCGAKMSEIPTGSESEAEGSGEE